MFRNLNLGLLIIRLSLGVLMLFHGIAKLAHGVDFISGILASKGLPSFIAYGVYIGEVIAPIFIVLGFRTRIASLILFINMLVIVFLVHMSDIFTFSETGGWKLELVGFYMFGGLALFFMGGGKYALSKSNTWD